MSRIYTLRPTWVDTADVGTVLISPSGDFRVIRKVTRGSHRRYPIFSFAIRHCSWTRRPYTVYTWGELVRMGYIAAGASVELKTPKDRILAKEIAHKLPRRLYCWDVVGGQMP